jgi:hypothetical protein
MSDLEQKVKNIIKGMIVDAARVSLLPADTATIAAFAFKTAVIYDHVNLSGAKRPFRGTFFSPKTRQDFRQFLTVPEGVHIWLAKFVSRALHAGRLRGGYFKFKGGPWKDFHFFVTTYAVGHFAFQILCSRFRGRQHHKISPPRVIQHPKWNGASVLMWPNHGLPVDWPPRQHFTDDSIDAFANRWEVA